MSREIKFRAWDKEFKRFSKSPLKYPICDINYHTDYIWMQYTGLKDSKGVEIYEGDIVNVNNFGGTPRYEKVGFYTNAGFAGLHPFTDSGHHWSSKNCEIIGNIYENPELLEEQS